MADHFQLHNVVKSYRLPGRGKSGYRQILAGTDWIIPAGRISALIGESGSGKSTLARVLMRLEPYDSGDIFYKSARIDKYPLPDFRRQNQIVFQNPQQTVHPLFSVQKILREPLLIQGIRRKDIPHRLQDILEILKIPGRLLARKPWQLSGGELQRIVLARALLLEPEFVILDEPFTAVDDIMAQHTMRLITDIRNLRGLGVLLICHRMDYVAEISEHIAVLRQGRIQELSPHTRSTDGCSSAVKGE